jgi:hypothetical protein
MKMVTFIIIALISLSITPVYGDVINPDQKQIDYYYQIININNYPDYVFLIHGNPTPSFMVLNSSQFNFYKFSTVNIYAVSKSDFNQGVLENMSDVEIENYFTNNKRVLKSHLELEGTYATVERYNSLEKVGVELEITNLNQTNFEIKKTRAKFYYVTGEVKTINFQNQNTTPPPGTSLGDMWYYILPIIAFTAIILMVIRRRSN